MNENQINSIDFNIDKNCYVLGFDLGEIKIINNLQKSEIIFEEQYDSILNSV